MASILFVSSNNTWGGSEILWSEAAKQMAADGLRVCFAVKYNVSAIQALIDKGALHINLNFLSKKLSFHQRILNKIKRIIRTQNEIFYQELLNIKPSLVIISQGNNLDGNYYMNVCKKLSIPFITLTQLVTEVLWMSMDDKIINSLRTNYALSQMNYFVSQDNLNIHNAMLGEDLSNSKIISNPFTVPYDISIEFPSLKDNYHIALVGRLDTFHKGQDLLLTVLKQPQWKSRAVIFSFYGEGPHRLLLERMVKNYNIKNVVFRGYVNDVTAIWKNNHLLILPSRMEGQSLALIEAMWCCRGAIVTNVGDAKKLLTEDKTGFIANFPSAEAIDEKLEKAWQMKEQWEEIGKNAGKKIRELYSKHPVDTFVKEIKEVVNNIESNQTVKVS